MVALSVRKSPVNDRDVCKRFDAVFVPLAEPLIIQPLIEVQLLERRNLMEKYVCQVCGYVYDPSVGDPDNGVAAGTSFADVPGDWACPVCGADKDSFSPE